MKKLFLVIFLGLTLLIAGQSAYAVSDEMVVTATVSGACSSISADSVSIDYTAGGVEQLASASIDVVCTSGTSVNISIDAGSSCETSTVQNRSLCGNGVEMAVNLYEGGTETNFASTNIASTTGNGQPDTVGVDIVVPGNQDVPPGDYANTFTVSTDL